MDPYNKDDRRHFFAAVKHHRKVMSSFLRTREQLVRDLAGAFFGKSKIGECKTVINLTLQMAESTMLSVAAKRPRVLVTAKTKGKEGFARHYQLAINNLAEEIHLDETFKICVLNAFFGLSPAKVYLAEAPEIEIETDVWMDPGKPFVTSVSPDDFAYDTSATDFRKVRFAGDRRRVRFNSIREVYDFSEEQREKIKPISRHDYDTESNLVRNIGKGLTFDPGEFEPMVDLIDVYFPYDNMIATWACRGDMEIIDTDPLVEYEWTGMETGPYHLLNLGPVPENTMPTSPAQNLKYLSDLANSLYRMLSNQAERFKEINIADTTATEDVRVLNGTKPGEWATVQNKEGLGVFKSGGIDQQTWQFANSMVDMFDRMGGNLSARMGLGPQSDTASQDRMIMGQVSRHESFMQENMLVFASGVMQHLGYLLFTDPVKEIPGKLKLQGSDIEYTSNWTPDRRTGKFNDYDLGLESYSLAYKSPSDRAGALNQFVGMMLPMFPMLQQFGYEFDLPKFIEIQAELMDMPRLNDLFKPSQPEPQAQGTANQATQSPITSRETIRRSEGGGGQPPPTAGQIPIESQSGMGGSA